MEVRDLYLYQSLLKMFVLRSWVVFGNKASITKFKELFQPDNNLEDIYTIHIANVRGFFFENKQWFYKNKKQIRKLTKLLHKITKAQT